MKNPLVSVIVPVYNAAEYIDSCLQSLLNQEREDWTAIIIDDGSTDETPCLLEKYAQRDERFLVIRQNNKGTAAARNLALEQIKTPYFCLLDADDSMTPDALSLHLDNMLRTGSDISLACYLQQNKYGEIYSPVSQKNMLTGVHRVSADSLSRIHLCGWNKLYKTEMIQKYHIRFDETQLIGEDVLFVYTYLTHCSLLSFCDKALYTHVASSVSVMEKCARGEASAEMYESNFKVSLKALRYVLEQAPYPGYVTAFGSCMLTLIFAHRVECRRWMQGNKSLRRELNKIGRQYQWAVMKLLPLPVILRTLLPLYAEYISARVRASLAYRYRKVLSLVARH